MDYADIVPGKLKLKKPKGSGGVRKRTKKELPQPHDQATSSEQDPEEKSETASLADSKQQPDVQKLRPKTKAELSFEQRRRQLQAERVMKKAEKSHKQRVEAFNQLLSSVPEFNDIPKVSWTK